jgi:signal transduction histidine kinase
VALLRRDLVALLLAAVTAFAGLAAWAFGTVDLGLVLDVDGSGRVTVVSVAPESIAAREGFFEGQLVIRLESIDTDEGEEDVSLPSEALPQERIRYVATGFDEGGEVFSDTALYRPDWEMRLNTGGWLLFLGAAIGALVAVGAARGWLGSCREDGTTLGVAVAIPFMASPLFYTGTPVGEVGAFLLAAGGTLPLARSLADRLTIERWPTTLFAASVVVAMIVGLTVVRSTGLSGAAPREPVDQSLLIGFITILPAVAAAFGTDRARRERTELVLVGVGPAAAATILGWASPNPAFLLGWLAIALGWRRATSVFSSLLGRRWPTSTPLPIALPPTTTEWPEDTATWRIAGLRARELMALGITLIAAAGALVACCSTWPLLLGFVLGGAVALSIRGGFLGPGWRDAAIPLACAVAIPILSAALAAAGGANSSAGASVLVSLGALPAAHLLAQRHPDRQWRRIIFLLAAGLAVIAISAILVFPVPGDGWYASGRAERYLLMGMIALAPGLVVAFSGAADGMRITDRLDTLVVALTPGAAITVLVPSFGPFLLMGWLIGLVVWRRLTIAPLLGLAQRSQRQRDLAVVAIEAERARLAADLHDDALQELSALVRRLDAAGDEEGAGMARGVAERLRTITSDLRLPVLDDLGAGPALEWLVGRVRPLAAGPVVLERVDADRPPAGVELAVFRVAQEALANAVKHGKPPITVRYRVAEDGGVSLSVDDSGSGIEAGAAEEALQAGHMGMANMQQRAEQIGALLDVRRWPAGGTHVAMEWRPR